MTQRKHPPRRGAIIFARARPSMHNVLRRLRHNPARLLLLAALLATACLCYNLLFLDFWNDEVFTLKNFQVVPLTTTLTDYHDVNNHIGFNLLCNLYLHATGQRDLLPLLLHPERLRIFLVLIPLGITALVWRISMNAGGIKLALINLILFLTTLPFYNFTMQLRGYGLAMLLVLAIVHYLYAYYTTGSLRHCGMIGVLMAALFYVHPANIYFMMALFPATALLAYLDPARTINQKIRWILWLWVTAAGATATGILLYLPMWDVLFANPLVGVLKSFYWGFFRSAMLYNTVCFISGRWLAAAAAVAGLVLHYRKRSGAVKSAEAFFWCCVVLYGGAYVVAFLHKDPLIVRVFIPVGVLFILGFGQCLYWLDAWMAPRYRQGIFIGIMASCLCSLPLMIFLRNRTIDENNLADRRPEHLTISYYTHNLRLRKMLHMAQEHAAEKDFILVCVVNNSYEMQEYLKAAHVPFHGPLTIDSATAGRKSLWLITTDVNYFKEHHPGWQLHKINRDFTYPNFYHVTR